MDGWMDGSVEMNGWMDGWMDQWRDKDRLMLLSIPEATNFVILYSCLDQRDIPEVAAVVAVF